MNDLFLDDPEVDTICGGYKRNADRVKHLKRLGLVVNVKPNGRPLVVRAHAEAVLSGRAEVIAANTEAPVARAPNRDALVSLFRRKAA